MKRRLYCIYDTKAESPINGIFQSFNNDDDAKRMFGEVVLAKGTMVQKYPADFALMFVGTVDYESLILEPNPFARSQPVLTGDACVRAFERARAEFANVPGDGAQDAVAGSISPR